MSLLGVTDFALFSTFPFFLFFFCVCVFSFLVFAFSTSLGEVTSFLLETNLGETIEYKAAAFHFPLRHDSSFLVPGSFFFATPLYFLSDIYRRDIERMDFHYRAPFNPLTSSILDFNRWNRFPFSRFRY